MNPVKPVLVAALVLSLPAVATAQGRNGFTSDGIYGIESVIASGGGNETNLAGDLNFRFRPSLSDSFGTLGFFVGITGMGGTLPFDYAYYLGLAFYNVLSGNVLVGIPRPGSYGYNNLPLPGGGIGFDLSLGSWNYRYGIGTYEAISFGRPAYGVRYEHENGETDYAVSLSQLRWGGDINLFSFGARRQFGDTQVFGTLEHTWGVGGTITNGAIGLRGRPMADSDSLGPIEAGGALFFAESGGSSNLGAQAFVTAHPTDRLGVTLSAITLQGAGTFYGLSGAYGFGNNVEVQAGVVASDTGGPSHTYNIGLYQRF